MAREGGSRGDGGTPENMNWKGGHFDAWPRRRAPKHDRPHRRDDRVAISRVCPSRIVAAAWQAGLVNWAVAAKIAFGLSLALLVFGSGLRTRLTDVTALLRRPILLGRSLVAVLIFAPALAIALVKIFDLHHEVLEPYPLGLA
jgi:hypothetical protein